MKEIDYRKIILDSRVFIAKTESFPTPLGADDYFFLDTEFDKDVNLDFSKAVAPKGANFIFLPGMLKDLKFPDISSEEFYARLYDEFYDIYDDYLETLNLPETFRFGIVHHRDMPFCVRQEDGSRNRMMVFTCCSFTKEMIQKFDYNVSLLLKHVIQLIHNVEGEFGPRVKRVASCQDLGLVKMWRFHSDFSSDMPTRMDQKIGNVEEINRYDESNLRQYAKKKSVYRECDNEDIELKKAAYEQSIEKYEERIRIFRLEYGRNYSTALKVSDDRIAYIPKNYLILHATRNNYTTIRLSPSQMAIYCYVQGYNKYGISKEHLIEDINSHRGKYRKLCTLFNATHTDYDVKKIKVVVSQINSRIKRILSTRNTSDNEFNFFDFTPWTETITIKSNESYRYFIGVSDIRFKPVIVDENRQFVNAPMDYIDKL